MANVALLLPMVGVVIAFGVIALANCMFFSLLPDQEPLGPHINSFGHFESIDGYNSPGCGAYRYVT